MSVESILWEDDVTVEDRLDEQTEAAIREVLTIGLRHSDFKKVPPDKCEFCQESIKNLRSRIRELLQAERDESFRRGIMA